MRAVNGNAGPAQESGAGAIDFLNRAARRLRYPAEDEDWGLALLDAVLLFSRLAALFWIDGETARLERARAAGGTGMFPEELVVPLSAAAAFQTVIQSRDSVVALSAPREISMPVVKLLALAPDIRLILLPLLVRNKVTAIVLAAGQDAPWSLNGLELIATLAGSVLESRTAEPPKAAVDLVSIKGLNA